MFVAETQVLQLGLDREQTETMCQWGVDIQRFTGNLILLVFGLRREGAHVMQPVGYLYKYDTDVVRHSQQQLTEVLRLFARLVTKHTAADLRQSIHYMGNLIAEQSLQILDCVVGVLHHVMK